jgi:hypothetical protein
MASSNPAGGMAVSCVCCQIEVSAMGRSLVLWSPTDVLSRNLTMRTLSPSGSVEPWKKKNSPVYAQHKRSYKPRLCKKFSATLVSEGSLPFSQAPTIKSHSAPAEYRPHLTFVFDIVFRHVRKIAYSDYQLRHVCPSVNTDWFGSHWTDWHKIWYLSTFLKSKFN